MLPAIYGGLTDASFSTPVVISIRYKSAEYNGEHSNMVTAFLFRLNGNSCPHAPVMGWLLLLLAISDVLFNVSIPKQRETCD